MVTNFCWEGECVNYGILSSRGTPISQGRFRCSDLEPLLTNPNFTFQETSPESLGLQRESDECSAFNDFLFPPEFPPVIPPRLILEVKNDVTNRDVAPIDVNFDLIANPEIDRVAIVKVIWDFGDGSPLIEAEGLFGQQIGFRQRHTYQTEINFQGTVTLQILDSARNVLDQETVTFAGQVLGEPFTVPLNIILDVFPDSDQAPSNVNIAIIANQAIENIVVDWGDGSPSESIGNSANHTFTRNGIFNIVVSATSRLSGERTSTQRTLTLAIPPPPPGEEQLIFEVRKAVAGNSLVAPATINYTMILNPNVETRTRKFKISWTDFMNQQFVSAIKEGTSISGKSQSFIFPTPGSFTIQGMIEEFQEVTVGTMTQDVLVRTEIFNDQVTILLEEEIVEPPIVDPPIEPPVDELPVEEEPEEPMPGDGVPPEPGPIDEEPIPGEAAGIDRNTLIVLAALGVAAGVGIAVASSRKEKKRTAV